MENHSPEKLPTPAERAQLQAQAHALERMHRALDQAVPQLAAASDRALRSWHPGPGWWW